MLVEAPPGAGKSSLTVSVANALTSHDQTAATADRHPDERTGGRPRRCRCAGSTPSIVVARLRGASSAPSTAMLAAAAAGPVLVSTATTTRPTCSSARVVVATARKWEFVRSGQQQNGNIRKYDLALIDEAYQMRSDALLGIAGLFDRLMCVGDPGQLDPFTTVDDSLWKGLEYSPSRTAMGTLRAFHPDITPHQLPTSWRLPPSAAGIVSTAFYPFSSFDAGTAASQRSLTLGEGTREPTMTTCSTARPPTGGRTSSCPRSSRSAPTPRSRRDSRRWCSGCSTAAPTSSTNSNPKARTLEPHRTSPSSPRTTTRCTPSATR